LELDENKKQRKKKRNSIALEENLVGVGVEERMGMYTRQTVPARPSKC